MANFTIFTATYYNVTSEIGTGNFLGYSIQDNSPNNPFFGASTYSEQTGSDNNLFVPNEVLTADYALPLGTNAVYLGQVSFTSPDDGVTRLFYAIDDALSSSILLGSITPNLDYVHFPTFVAPTDIVATSFIPCFLAGCCIDTPDGPRPVEDLIPGEMILTHTGKSVPVRFNHRRTVPTLFGPADRLMPVRVSAGALGDGVPLSDLVLTADHALLIDGLLINAGVLVNGSTIDYVPLSEFGDSYTVYHVETENHDVILAEGAPAETYIDYVGRQSFDNYAEYLGLYGEDRTIPEMPYPRMSAARMVPEALRQRLTSRQVA